MDNIFYDGWVAVSTLTEPTVPESSPERPMSYVDFCSKGPNRSCKEMGGSEPEIFKEV